MEKKRVLFIYPPLNQATLEGERENLLGISKIPIELSFAYLDTFIKQKIDQIETRYLDFRVETKDNIEHVVLDTLSEFPCTHVGITCYSRHFLEVIKLTRIIKNIDPNLTIIVGGFHPTIKPGDFTGKGDSIDHVIRGEGEIALYHILKHELPKMRDKVIIHDGKHVNLDDVPILSLGLYERYKDSLDFDNLPVYCSRGCINNCSFCIRREDTCGLKSYRLLSPELVSKQFQAMSEYNPKKITIQDPLFGASTRWFTKIIEKIPNHDHPKIRLESHVDLLNQSRVNLLLEHQVDLTIGFETAAPRILVLMNKTGNPLKYIQNARRTIECYHDSGNELMLNVLFGHPGEERETLDKTFRFLNESVNSFNGILVKTSLFRYYPGTYIEKFMKFFNKMLGTTFYYRDWWLHDLNYSIIPSIIDPSRKLGLIEELEYIKSRTVELFDNILYNSHLKSISFKMFYLAYKRNVMKTYENFRDEFVLSKGNAQEKLNIS